MEGIEKTLNDIKEALRKGMSVEDIANELGLCRQTVYNYCHRYNIDYRTERNTIRRKVEKLHYQGLTVSEIQKELQCSRSYINSCLNRINCSTRVKIKERNKVLRSNLCRMLENPNITDFTVNNILKVTGLTRGQYQRLIIAEPWMKDKILDKRRLCRKGHREAICMTEEEKRVAIELRRVMNTKEIAERLNIPHSSLAYYYQCLRKEGKIELNGRVTKIIKRQFMEELKRYINDGYSLKEISEMMNMSESTMKYLINFNGLVVESSSGSHYKADRIEELFLNHLEVQDIALRVDTSADYVNSVIKERNLKERL